MTIVRSMTPESVTTTVTTKHCQSMMTHLVNATAIRYASEEVGRFTLKIKRRRTSVEDTHGLQKILKREKNWFTFMKIKCGRCQPADCFFFSPKKIL